MRVCAKHAWPSFDLAEGHRLLLLASGKPCDPTRLHSYLCQECGAWHVGHGRQAIYGNVTERPHVRQ